MTNPDTTHMAHIYVPGTSDNARTCVLLHGTGGDENDLIPLGKKLLPDAAFLSLRGNVNEDGKLRFFKRISPGVLDLEDLHARTHELDAYLHAMAKRYEFSLDDAVFIGYSNGANITASLMFLHPQTVRSVLLLHPMLPFTPETSPDLSGAQIFIGAGMQDEMVPPESTNALATLLHSAGADVQVHWEDNGHRISDTEIEAAQKWLELHDFS